MNLAMTMPTQTRRRKPEKRRGPLHEPAAFVDGPNQYQYVGGDPVGAVDPEGLWKIRRAGGKLASAEAENGDTIQSLATKIGLESTEFGKWITVANGQISMAGGALKGISSVKATDVCCSGTTVEIPNTVLAYWGGEFNGFGKWWVRWDDDVTTLKQRGFKVHEAAGWTGQTFESEMQTATKARELHGLFFWGHGNLQGVGTDSAQKRNSAYDSDYANWKPEYRLGFGVLFACYTKAGRANFASNAVFWGKRVKLLPHGFHLFGPTIEELLPSGAQGGQP